MLSTCQALCHLGKGKIVLKKWQFACFVTSFLVEYVSAATERVSYWRDGNK